MKYNFIFISLFVTTALLFPQTIITNGDFESGTLDGWTHVQGGQSAVSTDAHTGSYACQVEGRGTLEQIVEGLLPGTDYILTLYTKCGSGGRANPGATDYGRGKSAIIENDTTWQKVELRFRTGLESTLAKIYLTNIKTGTTIFADDFVLVEDHLSAFESSLPKAPSGYFWEKIPHLSDEFNADELDKSKWLNYHPYWSGRAPSNHHRNNVWVADGFLGLQSTSRVDDLTEVADPNSDIWVDAACVTSKNRNVSYGYYEARIKESQISMTSSFWFQGTYSEIDVIENLGAPSNNNGHENQMHMNTHYYPDGWDNDKKTPRSWSLPYPAGEDFHVYGLWWIDETRLNMYHNGQLVAEINLPGDYDEPMYMFFDTEVFTWEGLPTIESLNDPERNTMYVDWVRAWELVPDETAVDKKKLDPVMNFKLENYPNPFNPNTTIEYSLATDERIQLSVFNSSGRLVRVLNDGIQHAGIHRIVWDGRDDYGYNVASGIYIYRLKTSNSLLSRKMLLMR